MKRILLIAGLALLLAAFIEAKSVADADDGGHDDGVGRTKRHYPSWGRRSYWRDMWRNNQWWDQDWWNDWAGWDDADAWDAYDWSAYPWNGDWDYYGKFQSFMVAMGMVLLLVKCRSLSTFSLKNQC